MLTFIMRCLSWAILAGSVALPAMAQDASDRWRADNLPRQGLAPFWRVPVQPEIRARTFRDDAGRIARQLFAPPPTHEDLVVRELQALELLDRLRDPQAFETLLEVSSVVGPYSSSVAFSARQSLVRLMPQLTEDQRERTRRALTDQRAAMLEIFTLSAGSLGDYGSVAVAGIDSLIAQSRQEARKVVVNYKKLNASLAAREYLVFPFDSIANLLRIFARNPVSAVCSTIWALVTFLFAVADVFVDSFAGLETRGAEGFAGPALGQGFASMTMAALLVVVGPKLFVKAPGRLVAPEPFAALRAAVADHPWLGSDWSGSAAGVTFGRLAQRPGQPWAAELIAEIGRVYLIIDQGELGFPVVKLRIVHANEVPVSETVARLNEAVRSARVATGEQGFRVRCFVRRVDAVPGLKGTEFLTFVELPPSQTAMAFLRALTESVEAPVPTPVRTAALRQIQPLIDGIAVGDSRFFDVAG